MASYLLLFVAPRGHPLKHQVVIVNSLQPALQTVRTATRPRLYSLVLLLRVAVCEFHSIFGCETWFWQRNSNDDLLGFPQTLEPSDPTRRRYKYQQYLTQKAIRIFSFPASNVSVFDMRGLLSRHRHESVRYHRQLGSAGMAKSKQAWI